MKFNKYILYLSGVLNIFFAIFLCMPIKIGTRAKVCTPVRVCIPAKVYIPPKVTALAQKANTPAQTDTLIDASVKIDATDKVDIPAKVDGEASVNVDAPAKVDTPAQKKNTIMVRNYEGMMVEEPYNTDIDTHFKIGVIISNNSVPMVRIIEGLQGELAKNNDVQYHYSFYNANSNMTLLRSIIEEVLSKNFDLIFTIGHTVTLMTKEVSVKRGIETPIVFAAVADPVKHEIVESVERPAGNVTGSAAEPVSRHLQQLKLMLMLKPNFKRVVLPYNPAASIDVIADVNRIEVFLRSQGIGFQRVEVDATTEVVQKLSAFVQTGDMILTLRDTMITCAMEGIVKLACRHGISVFSSHIDTLQNGVVVAFGGREQDSGVGAAEKIRAILEQHQHPSNVPITVPEYKYQFVINKNMMEEQNFSIDPLMLFLIQSSNIID